MWVVAYQTESRGAGPESCTTDAARAASAHGLDGVVLPLTVSPRGVFALALLFELFIVHELA